MKPELNSMAIDILRRFEALSRDVTAAELRSYFPGVKETTIAKYLAQLQAAGCIFSYAHDGQPHYLIENAGVKTLIDHNTAKALQRPISTLDEAFRAIGFTNRFYVPTDLEPAPPPPKRYKAPIVTDCGKQAFTSQGRANAAARNRLRKKSTGGTSRLIAYHCPTCHLWHLTSRKPSNTRL